MGKKNKEQGKPEPVTLSREYSLAQAAHNLMVAAHVAHKHNDVENLVAVSALWMELSSRMEDDEDTSRKPRPIGFHHEED